MATWGNLQSAIQLTIAVNLAYYSFTEIRQSALARETQAFDSIREFVSSWDALSTHLHGDLAQLNIDLTTLQNQISRIDNCSRTVSLIISLIFLAMLVYASVMADASINCWAAFCICTAGFLPAIALMIANVRIARSKLRGLQQRRQALTSALATTAPPPLV